MIVEFKLEDIKQKVLIQLAQDGFKLKKFIEAAYIPKINVDALMYIAQTMKPNFMPMVLPYGIKMDFKIMKFDDKFTLEFDIVKIGELTIAEAIELEPNMKDEYDKEIATIMEATKNYFETTVLNQLQFTVINAQTVFLDEIKKDENLKNNIEVLMDKLYISNYGLSSIPIKHGLLFKEEEEYEI